MKAISSFSIENASLVDKIYIDFKKQPIIKSLLTSRIQSMIKLENIMI